MTRRNGNKAREKKSPKPSKYKNVRVMLDEHWFDSRAEACYYTQLKKMKASGKIRDFDCQVPFTLQESFVSPSTGRREPAIIYRADFVIYYHDGRERVVDVKGASGYVTQVFTIKRKLFEGRLLRGLYIENVNAKKDCPELF